MSDESQKPVTQSYRDNWEAIWGKKEEPKPCKGCEAREKAKGNGSLMLLAMSFEHTCGKS